MTQMTQNAEMEANAELLLEAQGFTGAVVSISDGSADVIVNAAELSEAERAQIEDAVKRKTEIPGENIVITPQGAVTETDSE
jgi:stage III sporulation protein AH